MLMQSVYRDRHGRSITHKDRANAYRETSAGRRRTNLLEDRIGIRSSHSSNWSTTHHGRFCVHSRGSAIVTHTMTDTLSPAERSAHMRRIRKTDTKPELAVRRAAHRLGHRFRLHRRDLPGTPDLVFPRLRKVILVHGCFWHQHPGCRLARTPAANTPAMSASVPRPIPA